MFVVPRLDHAQGWSPSPGSNAPRNSASSSSHASSSIRERDRRPLRRRTSAAGDKQVPRESFALGVDTNVLLRYIKEVSAKVDEDAIVKTQKIERAKARRRGQERTTNSSPLSTEGGRQWSPVDNTTPITNRKGKERLSSDSPEGITINQTISDVSMDVDMPDSGSSTCVNSTDSPNSVSSTVFDSRDHSNSSSSPCFPRRNEPSSEFRKLGQRTDNARSTKTSSTFTRPSIIPSSGADQRRSATPEYLPVANSQRSGNGTKSERVVQPPQPMAQNFSRPKGPPVLGMRRHTSSQAPSASQYMAPNTNANSNLPTKQKQFRPPLVQPRSHSVETTFIAATNLLPSKSVSPPSKERMDVSESEKAPDQGSATNRPSSPAAGDDSFRSADFDMGVDDDVLEKVCSMYD